MKEWNGKRVLLIALGGYSQGIKEKMEKMGLLVDYFNDKPNDGVLCKTAGRLKLGWYERVLRDYYRKTLVSVADRAYDYILVLRGEYTPGESVRQMKEMFPDARLILYMWDSLKNNRGIQEKWEKYDVVYTFDRIDYLAHPDKLRFLPLYYYEDYLPQPQSGALGKKYDIAFIGTGHEERVRIAEDVAEQCRREGLSFFQYIFLPHRLVYLCNKLTNPNYRGVKSRQIHYQMLPIRQAYETYGQALCVMDVESAAQHGLTMRTIEMLGLRKKLITTNQDIVNYDFYHPDNILVADRKNFRIDPAFLRKPYVTLPEGIYRKYSLENWICQVLEGEKTEGAETEEAKIEGAVTG